jgi:hypothetical protein
LLKVADAAMHKLRAATRGALGKVVRFKQCRAQTARDRVDCHPEAGCSAANDDDIPFPFVFQSAEKLIAIHETCEKRRGLMMPLNAIFYPGEWGATSDQR